MEPPLAECTALLEADGCKPVAADVMAEDTETSDVGRGFVPSAYGGGSRRRKETFAVEPLTNGVARRALAQVTELEVLAISFGLTLVEVNGTLWAVIGAAGVGDAFFAIAVDFFNEVRRTGGPHSPVVS